MKHGVIRIELRSDLCAGSGYAFGGIVDEDICYDDCGIPYIPARRLKGCLKEAAEDIEVLVSEETRKKLFGEAKASQSGGLFISNARIDNYETIHGNLLSLMNNKELREALSPQAVLELFTNIRAQIAMDEGVTKDDTLRFVRTVNQTSPFGNGKNLCFYAEVEYPEILETELRNIVLALRNIGYGRNRGLGNVRCSLQKCKTSELENSLEFTGKNRVEYEVRNTEPLMISAEHNNISLSYIPGKNVLGALAGEYLRDPAHSPEDEQFINLFLNGHVRYSNLYLSEKGNRSIPVPSFICRLKKSKKLVNVLQTQMTGTYEDADYDPTKGNQPKRLEGKYLCIDDQNNINVKETNERIIYHHRKNVSEDDQLLYSHRVIEENQTFAGYIEGSEDDLKTVWELLKKARLRFGKSKTAQYGTCMLMNANSIHHEKNIELNAGDVLLVSMASDTIFRNDYDYTVKFDEVYELTARELGIWNHIKKLNDELMLSEDPAAAVYSVVYSTDIYGYQTTWNLRKSPIPAIRGGSTLAYLITSDHVIVKEKMIGERNLEGYGEIVLNKMSDYPYRIETHSAKNDIKDNIADMDQLLKTAGNNLQTRDILAGVLMNQLNEKICGRMIRYTQIRNNTQKIVKKMTPSRVGRLTLMLRESLNYSKDADKNYQNFIARINSMKDTSREDIVRLFNGMCSSGNGYVDAKSLLGDLTKETEYTWLCKLITEKTADQRIASKWGNYAMLFLTEQKYSKKD